MPYRELHKLMEDFQTRPILSFDESAATNLERLRRERIRVGTMDLKIAAIVMAHDATLVTLNRRDFEKIPGLKLSDWRPD